MMQFTKREVVSATQLVRQFSTYLNEITSKSLRKLAIVRNNEMEAVVISINEYERLLQLEGKKFNSKSPKNYFGIISEKDSEVFEQAVAECRKVDENEW